jgi:pimeloyl-ACP methyl ester carboxylesterase
VNEVRQGMKVLTMPVLLLWGRQDNVVPLSQATQAVPSPPHARLEILQGCGHAPQVELLGKTARAALNFLAQSCGC